MNDNADTLELSAEACLHPHWPRKQTADAMEEEHLALLPPFGLRSLKPTQSIRWPNMNFKDSILLKRNSKQKDEAIDHADVWILTELCSWDFCSNVTEICTH